MKKSLKTCTYATNMQQKYTVYHGMNKQKNTIYTNGIRLKNVEAKTALQKSKNKVLYLYKRKDREFVRLSPIRFV